MNPVERNAQIAQIVELKSRGLSHARIASLLDISEDTSQRAMKAFRESNPSLRTHDPIAIIDQMLEGYNADLEELAVVSNSTKNESVRVGAINSRMAARDRIIGLLQATGVLPHDLGKLRVEVDIRYVAQRLVTILEKYEMPDAAVDELMAALGTIESQN